MEAPTARPLVVAQQVRKQFFRKGRDKAAYFDAVAGVSLELEQGTVTVVMGRSGSGKSTLLNMMAGLLAPSEGTVLFDGESLYSRSDEELSRLRNARMGVVPQGHAAVASLTVEQNVLLPYTMYRAESDHGGGNSAEARAAELLDRLGIRHLADAYPRELSGGEMRRMGIARALACSPDVVFADEPTGDLDDANTELVFELLREQAQQGSAVMVVTHEACAQRFADRVLHMSAGALVED